MAEAEQSEQKPRKLTREEVREATTCPVCKAPGAYLGERCRKCGSWQDTAGQWHTPPAPDKATARGGAKSSPWFDWE